MNQKIKRQMLLLIPIVLFIVDRVTKLWAHEWLAEKSLLLTEKHGGFGFVFYKNTGIAFGLPLEGWLLAVVLVVVFVFLLYELYKNIWREKNWLIAFCILLIMLGALGNIIDRLMYGYVVDFINVFWWPAFNVADCMIVVGVVLWVLALWKNERKTTRNYTRNDAKS